VKDILQKGHGNLIGRMHGLGTQIILALNDLEALSGALELCGTHPAQYKINLELIRATHQNPQNAANRRATWSYRLTVLLVQPEAVFESLVRNCRSVIVASGTLAPVASFRAELGDAFASQLLGDPVEAPHVIHWSQLCTVFVGHSPSGFELKCVRDRMSETRFMIELGKTILEVASEIPGGVLVFLPSKPSLQNALQAWRAPGPGGAPSIWDQLVQRKSFALSESLDSGNLLLRHEEAVQRSGHSVLFCVYRGRSSEGVSLSDNAVRGVICVGIPFPPLEADVKLKKLYNDVGYRRGLMSLDGETWYKLDAFRAINQALGRTIRHRRDFGSVTLIDSRWTEKGSVRAVQYLPQWPRRLHDITDNLRGEHLRRSFSQVLDMLRNHFERLPRVEASQTTDNHFEGRPENVSAGGEGERPVRANPESMSADDEADRRVRARLTQ